MEIEIGTCYVVTVFEGDRVAKAMEIGTDELTYGVYSPSEFQEKGDNQSISMNGIVVREATTQETTDWDNWYN